MRQEQPDLIRADRQPRAERGDAGRQQRGGALRADRQPDVGRADDLARQARRWRRPSGRRPSSRRSGASSRRGRRARRGRRPGMPPVSADIADCSSGGSSPPSSSGAVGEQPAHGVDRPGRRSDRRAWTIPAAWPPPIPSGSTPQRRGSRWGSWSTSSSQRSASRTASMTLLRSDVEHARVALGRDRLPRHVLGQVPVDRAALPGHQVGELPQGVRELLRVAERARPGPTRGPAGRRTERRNRRNRRNRRDPGPEPPGRPKPKGGSVISAASQAGWNGHVTSATLSRERRAVSDGDAEVRRRLSRAAAPAAGPGRAGSEPAGPQPRARSWPSPAPLAGWVTP